MGSRPDQHERNETRDANLKILDATAGNRTIWKTKESTHILFIDIEPELEVHPDKIIDCTKTGFPEEHFTTIFFDPPHGWGKGTGEGWYSIRNQTDRSNYKWTPPREGRVTYYGWDKYKTKSGLLSFLHRAQKEFHRILREDGMLWFKWNEVKIPLNNILPFFKTWDEMLRFPISSPLQKQGESQTYWIMFMKSDRTSPQAELSDFMTKADQK